MYAFLPMRKKATGRWDYAIMDHLGATAPFGPCMAYYKSGHKEGHHATKEEAVKCFLIYAMDIVQFDGAMITPDECFVCHSPAMRHATLFGTPFVALCSNHLNKDALRNAINSRTIEVCGEASDVDESLIAP